MLKDSTSGAGVVFVLFRAAGGSYHPSRCMRSISIGKAMPSMHEFLRICEYLGVTPQEFFTGAGDETDRINIFNRLQDLDDGGIQKLQTFLGWMEEK